jgi:hypothetical protein
VRPHHRSIQQGDCTLQIAFKNEAGTVEFSPATHRIAGRSRLDRTIFAEDFAVLKSVAPPGTTLKLMIPSPSMLYYRGRRAAIDPAAYPELEAFRHDLAATRRLGHLSTPQSVQKLQTEPKRGECSNKLPPMQQIPPDLCTAFGLGGIQSRCHGPA